jgi:hypothetical protein
VFSFIEKIPKRTVAWWPSARQEVLMMAHVIPLMYADVGSPLVNSLFATDAMGANNIDHGGYGIVCAHLSDSLMRSVYTRGRARGFTVARLDGDFSGLKHPEKEISRSIPFSLLPSGLFDKAITKWHLIEQKRWKYKDHVTLGEGRAVVRLLRFLGPLTSLHRSKFVSLQDNMPVSGSFSKGRSPSPPLLYLTRMKAAQCLAFGFSLFLPWVQTSIMPADEASRSI